MNKIVCNVCGTAYPESATQCPICGYVQAPENVLASTSANSTYTYVKGGRFSKANVKKRNQSNPRTASANATTKSGKNTPKTSIGSLIIIVVLLLAIIAVIGYIALRFIVPNGFLFEGFDGFKKPSDAPAAPPVATYDPTVAPTDPTEAPTIALDCTAIVLNATDVQLDGIGKSFKLEVTVEPSNTPDVITFNSSDETIATVSEDGTITAVGSGNVIITVACGSVSSDCIVECMDSSAEKLTLNRKEITFNTEGESWMLYDGEIPNDEIIWTSDDNQVATIESGKVVAVGNGTTSVFGNYKDQSVACIIHCNFDEDTDDESGEISEANGDPSIVYELYNPYGYADDVSVNPGEVFILKLVDKNLKDAEGAVWNVSNENVCTFTDNEVKAIATGTAEITATYAGKTYTCTVRVR